VHTGVDLCGVVREPALDRVEDLQLDGHWQQLGFDLLPLTNYIGVGVAQSATLVDTLGCDGSRAVAIGHQPFDLLDEVDLSSPPGGDNCCPLGAGGVAPQRLIDERADTGVPNPNPSASRSRKDPACHGHASVAASALRGSMLRSVPVEGPVA
jgi:hypothetical protein